MRSPSGARALDRLFGAAILSTAMFRGGCPIGSDAACTDDPAQTFFVQPDAGTLPEPGSALTLDACRPLCGWPAAAPPTTNDRYTPQPVGCEVVASDAGAADAAGSEVACHVSAYEQCPIGGRRTAGVAEGRATGNPNAPVGAFLAYSAALEASSVHAFRRLRAELASHRAPRSLLRALSRASRDEARHARAVGALARREGVGISPASCGPLRARDVETIARENAVEGCVFETYAALLATWQASHARDPLVRGAMRRIARDERRHAALAWTLARWADGRLERPARERIASARLAAFDVLRARVANAASPLLVDEGLVPSAREAPHLVDALARGLVRSRPARLRRS